VAIFSSRLIVAVAVRSTPVAPASAASSLSLSFANGFAGSPKVAVKTASCAARRQASPATSADEAPPGCAFNASASCAAGIVSAPATPADTAAVRNADSRRSLIAAIFSSRLIVAISVRSTPVARASASSSSSLRFANEDLGGSPKIAVNAASCAARRQASPATSADDAPPGCAFPQRL